MNKVNRGRVLIGGIVGGIVIFLIMGFVNHMFLDSDWKQWMSSTGAMVQHPPMNKSMTLWFLASLLEALTGTAIYAGIRPRYGPGPRTALWSGFLVWVLSYTIQMFNSMALGFLPQRVISGEWYGGLIAALAGVFVGAAIYKE